MTRDERSPTLTKLLETSMLGAVEDFETCLPGRVLAYDRRTRRARVQPIVKRKLNDATQSQPAIDNVPIIFPGGQGFSMTWPVRAGDLVLLVFASCSLERLLAGDGAVDVDPQDARRNHLTDAFAIPGLKVARQPLDETSDVDVVLSATGDIRAGGDNPLVTREEFLNHGHATAALGPVSPPVISPAPGSSVTFPGTKKLRG